MHNTSKTNKLMKENSEYLEFLILCTVIFPQFLYYMWILRVKNVKSQAATKSFIVALFYKTIPTQNTTNITEITKNLLKLVPHTNLKFGEKFTLIVFITIQHNLTLLTVFSNCHKFLTGTRSTK